MGGGKKQTLGYKYFMGLHMAICKGPIDALLAIMAADRVAWAGQRYTSTVDPVTGKITYTHTGVDAPVVANETIQINAPDLFGGEKREGGIQGALDVMMGEPDQAKNDYLVAQLGPRQPAYRGLFSAVFKRGMVAAMNPYLKPWNWRVRRIKKGWESGECWYPAKAEVDVGNGVICANPAHVVLEIFTDTEDGMGYPLGALDLESFEDGADLFHAEGLGLWVKWMRTERIEDVLRDVLEHANAFVIQDPATLKFRLVAMRDDYLLSELVHYGPMKGTDPENPDVTYDVPCTLEQFERGTVDESVNEVTVTWNESVDDSEGSITVQNLANIQACGGVVNQTKAYACCPTEAIASRLAQRDLDVLSALLSRVRIRADRRAYDCLPGVCIRLSWPPLGIFNMPVRPLRVTTGNIDGGEITIEGTEDVFGFGGVSYIKPNGPGWTPPSTTPQAPLAYDAFEAPFRDVVQLLGIDAARALATDAAYLGGMAARPTGVPINFDLFARTGSDAYVSAGVGDFSPSGTLADSVAWDETEIELAGATNMDQLEVGGAAFLGNHPNAEVVRIDGIAGNVVTIGRACLDTVAPPSWAAGTRFWGYDQDAAASQTEYVAGEVVSAKFVTNSTGGQLALGDAPIDSVTMAGRLALPYPPQGLEVNSDPDPSAISGTFVVTWRHRDRDLQGDTLVDQEEASVGPREDTRYGLRFKDAALATLVEKLDVAGATAAVVLNYTGDVHLELFAINDNGNSWHKHLRSFAYTPPGGVVVSTITAATWAPATTIIDGNDPP